MVIDDIRSDVQIALKTVQIRMMNPRETESLSAMLQALAFKLLELAEAAQKHGY
jgi:hypothetical protein